MKFMPINIYYGQHITENKRNELCEYNSLLWCDFIAR
jgi:hypothetical protein